MGRRSNKARHRVRSCTIERACRPIRWPIRTR